MHDYIYELSSSPIPENERYSLFDIPDWFHGSIADSVCDADSEERKVAIESFVRSLGSCCSYEDGELTAGFGRRSSRLYSLSLKCTE